MSCGCRNYFVSELLVELTEAEKVLFKELGWSQAFADHINPHVFYSIVAEDVFLTKKEGAAVEALRRGLWAIKRGWPERKTSMFDDLISIHPVFDWDYDKWVEQRKDN